MICGFIAATLLGCGAVSAQEQKTGRKPHEGVYIVYFNPADRECLPHYRERIDRLMTKIQAWYRNEMKRNGSEPMTFPLERDSDGAVVFVVKGDGRELLRSALMNEWIESALEVDVAGVDALELIVEDGGNGTWGDSGMWFSPKLKRRIYSV